MRCTRPLWPTLPFRWRLGTRPSCDPLLRRRRYCRKSFGRDLWLRDSVIGQLYSGVEGDAVGAAFGDGDAVVSDSDYSCVSFKTVAKEELFHAEAGVQWRSGSGISYFYGLTYLSEEAEGQPQGRTLGLRKPNFIF